MSRLLKINFRIFVSFAILLVLSACHKGKSPMSTKKSKENTVLKAPQVEKKPQKTKIHREYKKTGGWPKMSLYLKELCGLWPEKYQFVGYVHTDDLKWIEDLLAVAMPSVIGTTSIKYFEYLLHKRYGIYGLSNAKGALIFYTKQGIMIFVKDARMDTASKDIYTINRVKFSKVSGMDVLCGRYKSWAVIGSKDLILKYFSNPGTVNERVCREYIDRFIQVSDGNIGRDPYMSSLGIIPDKHVTIFWNHKRGSSMLIPFNHKSAGEIINYIKDISNQLVRLIASNSFKNGGLHVKAADMFVRSKKMIRKADVLLIYSKGSVVDAAALLFGKRYLSPYFFLKHKK